MLQILKLNKTYNEKTKALVDINLNIPRGIFGLIGPNGSGKSTLLRILATIQEPDNGSITFNNIDVLQEKNEIRKILGYLPQEFGLYPDTTAEALLDHIMVLKGMTNSLQRKTESNYLFELTNLQQYRKKKLHGFSGGMKQRFGIAQALIGKPQIIIFDEPTSGLDPMERDKLHNLLLAISEEATIILSTHIIADINELCNDMAIIRNGNIIAQLSPLQAIDQLKDKIWHKIIDRYEEESYLNKFQIISSKNYFKRNLIKIYAEEKPEGFEKSLPSLDEVYFAYIKEYIK